MDEKKLLPILKEQEAQAAEFVNDTDQLEKFLERLEQKLNLIPVVGDKLGDIPILISLVRAYSKREYTDIPIGSVIAILGGLLYIVSPASLFTDAIPGIGYVDDAAVIALVMKMVHDDVEEYRKWKKENGKQILEK